jgi:hypothetical protein
MLRVAIVDEVDEIHVARGGCVTVVCMPPVMRYDDCYDQASRLYTPSEAAEFRAYYCVPAANNGAGWADVLPSLICPCLTPVPLRLDPWPPCPLHDGPQVEVGVVEVAERMLAP